MSINLSKEELRKKVLLGYIEAKLYDIKLEEHNACAFIKSAEVEEGNRIYEIVIQIVPEKGSTSRWLEDSKLMSFNSEIAEDPDLQECEMLY